MNAVRHVDQLMALDDASFVAAAYASLLEHEADPEVLNFHLERLRAGRGKLSLIVDIAESPAAAGIEIRLPGARALIAAHKRANGSLAGMRSRRREFDTRLNRLENGLGRLAQELSELRLETMQRLEAIEDALAAAGLHVRAAARDGSRSPAGRPAASPADIDLSGLPTVARRILRELSEEMDRNNESAPP